jgi:hypothetical protein
MAKGIGLQPASLGLGRERTAKYTPRKMGKNNSVQKIPPIKKRHIRYTYIQMIPKWWPGTPWPIRFAPICEGTC